MNIHLPRRQLSNMPSKTNVPCQIAARSNKASDVRKFVQQLNLRRGKAAEQYEQIQESIDLENQPRVPNGTRAHREAQNTAPHDFNNEVELGPAAPNMKHSAQQGNNSRWCLYEAMMDKVEGDTEYSLKPCTNDGNTGDNSESDFVTALPDTYSSVSRKRKRSTKTIEKETNVRRRGSATEPVASHDNPEDIFSEPGKFDRNPSRWFSAEEKQKLVNSRWGQWENRNTKCESDPIDTADMGNGFFTSLGTDEVVQDDVI